MTPDFDMLRGRLQAAWAPRIKAGTHCRSCVTPIMDGNHNRRPRQCHICRHLDAIEAAAAAFENKLKAGVCPVCDKKLKTEKGARDHHRTVHARFGDWDGEIEF